MDDLTTIFALFSFHQTVIENFYQFSLSKSTDTDKNQQCFY